MSSLSEDNQLLSWSFCQETNGQISLKIRYQPTTEAANRDINSHYRKKPAKQVKRDLERSIAWHARQHVISHTQQRADPVTSDQATPPGDVSAVVTRAMTRSMTVSTRCDTPEAPRSDQTLRTDTPSFQPLNDDVSHCILEDNSDH